MDVSMCWYYWCQLQRSKANFFFLHSISYTHAHTLLSQTPSSCSLPACSFHSTHWPKTQIWSHKYGVELSAVVAYWLEYKKTAKKQKLRFIILFAFLATKCGEKKKRVFWETHLHYTLKGIKETFPCVSPWFIFLFGNWNCVKSNLRWRIQISGIWLFVAFIVIMFWVLRIV